MVRIIKLIIEVKIKMLLRNKFGKSKNISSWFVLLIALILFNWLLYVFKEYPIILIILFFEIITIINSHSIDDNSWMDSNIIYPIYPFGISNVLINLGSELVFKFVVLLPSLLFFMTQIESKEYFLVFFSVLVSIISVFFLTELAFKDIKFKKWFKVLLMSYLFLFLFFVSGSFDVQTLSIDHDYFFLSFLNKHSFISTVFFVTFNFLLMIVFVYKYIKTYRHQISLNEH